MSQLQTQMVFHGAVILFAGLLCGLPFGAAVARGWGDESIRSWSVAHSGVAGIGIMLIAIGAALGHMVLGRHAVFLLVWSLVVSGYAFTITLVLRGFLGVRGFELSGPALNVLAFLGNMVGIGGSLLGVGLAIYGTYAALTGMSMGSGEK